jgi:hypothetical protein
MRRFTVVGVAVLVLAATAVTATPTSAAPPQRHHGYSSLAAAPGPAGRLTAPLFPSPRYYTQSEQNVLNARMFDQDLMQLGRPGPATSARALGPQAPQPGTGVRRSATTLRDTTIPASGISGGAPYASFIQEPSTDANGGNIFQTGNWYATRSVDNGATWSYLDPFTLFGSGFCCDQVTQYDPATGHQFWLLQFSDHLVLANASAAGPGAFTSWCYWNITPAWFGVASTASLDFNDMTIANSNVYISTNVFNVAQTVGLLRLPKVAMSTCSGFSYNYVTRTDNFSFKLVPGSTDTLFWGSNWGQTNGSSFRVFSWAENSGTYSWRDNTVAAYAFYTRNSGQNCASTDGVVVNWCQFADSRTLGAYRSGGLLGFSFNAKQDASHPFPYTRIVRFNESDKSYQGASDLWGSWGAIQFMAMAPNNAGRFGNTFVWGGGTGTTHYYPGAGVNNNPNNGLDVSPNYYLWGDGNPCTYGGLYRWGDYVTVRDYQANPSQWIAGGYTMRGGSCGGTGVYAEPHNILFS